MCPILLPGDCYRIHTQGSVPHFFFIISSPDTYPLSPLVLVPMTSVSPDKNIDPACILSPAEHHTCVKPSFIDYRRAVLMNPQHLEQLVRKGLAECRPPGADPAFLHRLRCGAEESEFVIGEIFEILYAQGLVRPL